MKGVLICIIVVIFLIGCAPKEKIVDRKIPVGVSKMKVTSVFNENEAIPSEYTCDGEDKAPELKIEDVPENTKSLALIMDDPDAPVGTWDHWIVFNIPPDTKVITKGTEPKGTAGKNSWGKTGYGGPCPPSGTHRYFFKLYALDTTLDIEEGSDKKDLEKAMQDHTIEKAELMGTYRKQ